MASEQTNPLADDTPVPEVEVKCEIIEISDEELTFGKPKRKRIKKKLDPSDQVQCEECSKIFACKYLLKKHSIIHTGERPYMCTQCGRAFRQSYHLKMHEMTHSAENGVVVKNFKCDECNATFTRKSTLKIHEKIHTGEKPFSCEICSKSFVQKINLTYHVKTHTGDRKFECDACGKKLMTRSKLKQHYQKHIRAKMKMQALTESGEDSKSEVT